jgi:Homeodomain-like domain
VTTYVGANRTRRGPHVGGLVRERLGPWLPLRSGRLPKAQYRSLIPRAIELHHQGRATKAIGRELAVPRSTVRYWLRRYAGVAQSAEAIGLKPIQWGFESLHQHQYPAYAYLLGMYLGDGYIGRTPRTYVLRIYLHRDQHEVIERVRRAIATLLPGHRVGLGVHHGAGIAMQCYFQGWIDLFPQHGPGRKHSRRIILEPWQRDIVTRHPEEFIRGCIESDGCRHRRIVKGRNYPAYSFTNHSEDILGLFIGACGLVGVRFRRASRVTISIARRQSVARLDEIMGRPPEPGPFPLMREVGRRPYSFRSSVGSGLPIRKFAMAASS